MVFTHNNVGIRIVSSSSQELVHHRSIHLTYIIVQSQFYLNLGSKILILHAYAIYAMHEPFSSQFGFLFFSGQLATVWPKNLSRIFLKILRKFMVKLDLKWSIFHSDHFFKCFTNFAQFLFQNRPFSKVPEITFSVPSTSKRHNSLTINFQLVNCMYRARYLSYLQLSFRSCFLILQKLT